MPATYGSEFRLDVIDAARMGGGASGADREGFRAFGHNVDALDYYRRP